MTFAGIAFIPALLMMVSTIGCTESPTNLTAKGVEPASAGRAPLAAKAEGPPATNAHPGNAWSDILQNKRLKRTEYKDDPIVGDSDSRLVAGIWVPDSNDPSKAMVFPEQVKIWCSSLNRNCRESKVTLGAISGMVSIVDIDDTDWPIDTWDAHGLLASYGPDPSAPGSSDRCHRHVLTIAFVSGAVSTSDIPTHETGCSAFTETNSYRLARGYYYVDLSPLNDGDHVRVATK